MMGNLMMAAILLVNDQQGAIKVSKVRSEGTISILCYHGDDGLSEKKETASE